MVDLFFGLDVAWGFMFDYYYRIKLLFVAVDGPPVFAARGEFNEKLSL